MSVQNVFRRAKKKQSKAVKSMSKNGHKGDCRSEWYSNFEKFDVEHRNMAETLWQIEQLLSDSARPSISLIVGPPGVGKTHLIRSFQRQFELKLRPLMIEDPSYIPLIISDIPAHGGGTQSQKLTDLHVRSLANLGDRSTRRKIRFAQVGEIKRAANDNKKAGSSDIDSPLRAALEKALRLRRTRVVVWDEADRLIHFLHKGAHGRRLDILEAIAIPGSLSYMFMAGYQLLELNELTCKTTKARRV